MKVRTRMFAAVLVLVFVAGLVGAAAAAPKAKPDGKVPKLVIGNKTVQLGEVLEGQDYMYTYKLKNAGEAEAQILNVRPG
jgi:hypothetical protein